MSASLYRVINVFKYLGTIDSNLYSLRKMFGCKTDEQFYFCVQLFYKELKLMKEQGSENIDQANVLYSEYKQSFDSVVSGRSFIKCPSQDGLVRSMGYLGFNEAEQRIEIGKLQEELNKIIEKQKELLSDGKNPDDINKKLVLYAIDCLENVNLILKNFDKISIEFTVEELIKFQDKNQDMKDFTAKVTKFIEKYAPKVTYDFCIAMASGVLLGLGQ